MIDKVIGLGEVSIEPGLESKLVISKEFDPVEVKKEFKAFYEDISPEDTESRLYIYTPIHVGTSKKMGLFGDFAPSVVYAANKYNGARLPFREATLQEFAGSKLCHLYCTLDTSVIFGYVNRHMAKSKINNLNSVAGIMHRADLMMDSEPLENKEISDTELRDILSGVKKNVTKLLKEVRPQYSQTQVVSEKTHNLKYPGKLEKMFGGNLTKILLYGSSSAGGEGDDYDNIAVLNHLPEDLYEKIWGAKIEENGKQVGVIFVPEKLLDKFLYINVSNTLFRDRAKPLKGNFEFPLESEKYKISKEMYHAGFGSAKLISGMNLVFREPEILYDKPGLFGYFMKLNRFTLQGLSQKNGYVMKDKKEILDSLKNDFDFEIPPFRADGVYLQEAFLKANQVSVELAKKLYDSSLAREKNEVLVKLREQKSKKIFKASIKGKPVYVFGGRENMERNDIVPVVIFQPGGGEHTSRKKEIFHRGIDDTGNYLIGKRV